MGTGEIKRRHGREFELTTHCTVVDGRERWVAFIRVLDKPEHDPKNHATFTGWMKDEVLEKAEKWMLYWKN